jgi:hypothetical protein
VVGRRRNGYMMLEALAGITQQQGAGGATVTDSFDRANASTLGTADSGQAWTTNAGVFSIASNQASSSSSGGSFTATLDAGIADIDMRIDVVIGASNSNPGVVFRSVDISNFWHFTVAAGSWFLYKRVANSYTSMGSGSGPGSGTHTVRVVAVGSNIEVYINGFSKITTTDASHSTATKHGLGTSLLSGNGSGCQFNDLTITPAAVSGFVPTDLGATLALWLDADDASTFTYDAGVEISNWADKSGNGRDFAQSIATAYPTRQTSVVNGRAVVRFDGQNDYLERAQFAASFTAAEVFVVVATNSDPSANIKDNSPLSFSSVSSLSHYAYSGNGWIYEGFGSTARKTVGDPGVDLSSWHLYNVRTAASAWSAHIDGTSLYSTATSTVQFNGSIVRMGRPNNTATDWFWGDIAEMILCDTVLSSGDRTSVNTYIADKYGLTIA